MKKEKLLPNREFQGQPVHQRYNEEIVNKEVEMDAKGFVGSFKGSHFKDCIIKIRCAFHYTVVMTHNCSFENCLIWAHTKQSGGNWNASFKNCSFKGKYALRFEKSLSDCDFSNAKIDYLGLLANNDLNELKGIHYPVVAILDVQKNFPEWEKIEKPEDYDDLVWTSKNQPGMVIMNLKEHTSEPEKLWNTIEKLSFIKTN